MPDHDTSEYDLPRTGLSVDDVLDALDGQGDAPPDGTDDPHHTDDQDRADHRDQADDPDQ